MRLSDQLTHRSPEVLAAGTALRGDTGVAAEIDQVGKAATSRIGADWVRAAAWHGRPDTTPTLGKGEPTQERGLDRLKRALAPIARGRFEQECQQAA